MVNLPHVKTDRKQCKQIVNCALPVKVLIHPTHLEGNVNYVKRDTGLEREWKLD